MKNSVVTLFSFLVGLGTFPVVADIVAAAAVQTANGSSANWRNFIGSNQSASVGWSFSVGADDLELDELGFYDDGMDGLVDAHAVGIWTNGGALLAQVTVPSGTAGTLVGNYRYAPVAPLTLTAGQTYVVGTYFGPVADLCSGSACGDILLYNGTETYDPRISFLESRQTLAVSGAGTLAFTNVNATLPEGIFGPNFLLAVPVPPPPPPPPPVTADLSYFGLASVGIGILLMGIFQRRRPSTGFRKPE